jgi:hypothetical protein
MKLSCLIVSYKFVQIQKRNYAEFLLFEFQFNLVFSKSFGQMVAQRQIYLLCSV